MISVFATAARVGTTFGQRTLVRGPRLLSRATFVTLLNLVLAVAVAALLWRSLGWRVVGDAAIFHFIALQMQMGAVPYRDIVDINMPLIYLIHAAVVAVAGMSDVAWRIFDLAAAAVLSGLILMLVWPAGRAVAVHAALIVLVIHLLLGPYAAGQRDYLMSIAALGAALASARSAEWPRRRWLNLVLAGAFAATAAAIKPTGILLLGLPVAATGGVKWRDAGWIAAGAGAVGFPLLAYLALDGSLWPFIAMIEGLLPLYASIGSRAVSDVFRDTFVYLAPAAGLTLAAALAITSSKTGPGASYDRPYAVRARSSGRPAQGLVLPRVSVGNRAGVLGRVESCHTSNAELGRVSHDDGGSDRLAGANGAYEGNNRSRARRCFGHANRARKPVAEGRDGSGARFG